jgi:transcriptional regulator with XRE-family HTH domain
MNRLQELRVENGLMQKELAEQAEIKLGTLQKYEQGKNDLGKAEADTVIRLADVLGVSIKYLLGYSDER